MNDLLKLMETEPGLPLDYSPRPSKYLDPKIIYLAKGALSTPERKSYVRKILRIFPDAETIEKLDTPHNRIDLEESDDLERHLKGKDTLVFGEHSTAVRQSQERGNTCPNYHHFSPYGFCPYGCKYCYLAGTPGVWHSPAIKIYLNLDEIIRRIDGIAFKAKKETAFYLGKLQDGLALDPISGYSTVLTPFFASHPYARQVILTKSDEVDNLLDQDHRGHTIISWSLNPPKIAEAFEERTPSVESRIEAMKKCSDAGYPVRAVIMPVIPAKEHESLYREFITMLLSRVRPERITIGGICIYKGARALMERKMGRNNSISAGIESMDPGDDGRVRYTPELRARLYAPIIDAIGSMDESIQVALCLEEPRVWRRLGIEKSMGSCNCVL